MSRPPRIVVLGMLSKIPVAGVVWQYLHYLVGLQRLGVDVFYVETHARTPSVFMDTPFDDGAGRAAAFISSVCERAGLRDRWAYRALHDDGRCYGMSEAALAKLYQSADALVNLHGGTFPLDEHIATGRLVYLETDPVQLQLELADGIAETFEFLDAHSIFFTFAENYGRPGCLLPVSDRYRFLPTRQPVVLDFWDGAVQPPGDAFTTIGNWKQQWRDVRFGDEVLTWSKDVEFRKHIDLPARCAQPLELALGTIGAIDIADLEAAGWRVVSSGPLSDDADRYRDYICGSRGEFTVAKEQNVRLKTGWFSDRSATYLAAGRPVVTQDTGFGAALPEGEGLLAFDDPDSAAAALDAVNGDYERHARAAAEIAREYFDADRVLGHMLDELGLRPKRPHATAPDGPLPAWIDLRPTGRHPTTLQRETARAALVRPVPKPGCRAITATPAAAVVIPVYDGLPFTRMCLETMLDGLHGVSLEVIVVDNASSDGTADYLQELARHWANVRLLRNAENRGFAAAVNQGVERARAEVVVIANNDIVVPPRWLSALLAPLRDGAVGLVGAVTNRAGNEAQVDADYRRYAEFECFAEQQARTNEGVVRDLVCVQLFCAAIRRSTFLQAGGLDEAYGLGLFEDDDLSRKVQGLGLRTVCAEGAFVHHFGEATIGTLDSGGELFHTNRARFEERWGSWSPHVRRARPTYDALVDELLELVQSSVPPSAPIAVVSHGDERLVELADRRASHVPCEHDGTYAGHHPADGTEAVDAVERAARGGARYLVIPATSAWWLEFYEDLNRFLDAEARVVVNEEEIGLVYELPRRAAGGSAR